MRRPLLWRSVKITHRSDQRTNQLRNRSSDRKHLSNLNKRQITSTRLCKDGTVNRYVFDVPSSEQKHWLHWMKEQRLLYRLALGQPNQEDLVEILSNKAGMDPPSVRQVVVNLSPSFRRHTKE
jgi:hypothetical protein